MSLLDTLIINPNRKYDNIKNPDKRFLIFFIPAALFIAIIPAMLGFCGVDKLHVGAVQIVLCLIGISWRAAYFYMEKHSGKTCKTKTNS